jgi:hypothetical protein
MQVPFPLLGRAAELKAQRFPGKRGHTPTGCPACAAPPPPRAHSLSICPFPHLPWPKLSSLGALHASASAPALIDAETPAGLAGRLKDSALRAHSGGVTAILPLPDGLNLLTAGTDSRLRLWDARSRVNQLVTYEGTHNRALRARQLAVTEDARAVFYPSGSSVGVYEVGSGRCLGSLQGGHRDSINCVAYSPSGELFSGANDGGVVCWCFAGREADGDAEGSGDEEGEAGEGTWEVGLGAGGRRGQARGRGRGTSGGGRGRGAVR